ncbi:Uncharacterised protein [Mycobacteroides abscessus subsp. abscessus]|nr:Uncharacterised protein [Mycobacteroides abscessus subsp. abscessus]
MVLWPWCPQSVAMRSAVASMRSASSTGDVLEAEVIALIPSLVLGLAVVES